MAAQGPVGRFRGGRPKAIEYTYIYIYSYLSYSYFISFYTYIEFDWSIKDFSID